MGPEKIARLLPDFCQTYFLQKAEFAIVSEYSKVTFRDMISMSINIISYYINIIMVNSSFVKFNTNMFVSLLLLLAAVDSNLNSDDSNLYIYPVQVTC